MEQETRQELNEKLQRVEKELLEKYPNWKQEKARFAAKRLLCLIP